MKKNIFILLLAFWGISHHTIAVIAYDATSVFSKTYGVSHTFSNVGIMMYFSPLAPPTPVVVNWNNSNVQEITLSANRSFTFTNGKSGGIYTLIIKQDNTGARTVTWPTEVKWSGNIAPTLSTAAGAVDIVKFVFDGSKYFVISTTLNIPY